jgi:D-inositol-3-phosphate glycosyltransferase
LHRQDSDQEARLPDIQLIPHALDHERFFPLGVETDSHAAALLGNRRALRQQHWPTQPELWDNFIVLNANRNQPRKRIDITMQGFAKFAAGKSDVRLYLLLGLRDLGWNIVELADHYRIKEKLILGTGEAAQPIVTDDQLNVIYNLCDVGVNTALAEGWGLVSFEHAATGAAQIVSGFGNCAELWSGAADLLPPALSLFHSSFGLEENLISPRSVADALERLYADPGYLGRQSLAAYRRAWDPQLSPRRLASRWRTFFASPLGETSVRNADGVVASA